MLTKPQPTNIGTIICYSSKNQIIIQRNQAKYKSIKNQQYLVINRSTNEIRVQNNVNTQKMIKRTFSALFGIANLQGQNFIVFCDEAKLVCSVNKLTIFQIHSLFFFSFKEEHLLKRVKERSEIFRKIRDLNILLETGFYFSHEYNLTRTLEYQSLQPSENFVWNFKFLRSLKSFPGWKTYIIQGYVNFYEIFVQSTKIYYILISRRSIRKCGTRYFDRGINDQGHVANFVETEQILKINDFLISDIQIRGNVPIFFQQKGLTTKIKVTRGFQLTHEVYHKHLDVLKKYYQRIFWVNLLSTNKRGEQILIRQLQRHLKQANDKQVKYFYYDFHHEVQGGHFQNVDEAIKKVQKMKSNLKFYIYDIKNDKVIMRQQGVFRTNCLDCLDRTNFFQAKLAIITMEEILSCFQIKFESSLLEEMNDANNNSSEVVHFRKIWADNGDMISYHYTGTGSTHTDIIRDGKRGLFGGIKHKYKSVARFYNQNFWDFYKMNSIDLLFDEQKSKIENKTIPALIQEREAEFCEKKIVDLYLFSWKAPKKHPASLTLFPNHSDLIAISIQQISDQSKWLDLINQSVDSHHYLPIAHKISNNNLLMIFAKKHLKDNISNVQVTKVKFKSMYNQYLSSKCAVIIRCMIYSNKVTFIGCQLQFGREYATNRIQNLKDLHQFAFQEMQVGQKLSQSIINDDVIFLFGNTNTNISPAYKETLLQFNNCVNKQQKVTLQQRRLIDEMVESGQFSNIQESLMRFRYYEEQPIKFPPTYKFIKSKGSFDPQKSGWPDRIWYSTDLKIICSSYGVVEEMRQQHVPVYASYQVQLEDINQDTRVSVSEEVFSRISEARGYIEEPLDQEQIMQLEQIEERQATRVLDPL